MTCPARYLNVALMALFFLLVRWRSSASLSLDSWRPDAAALPIVAALAGCNVPALNNVAINWAVNS